MRHEVVQSCGGLRLLLAGEIDASPGQHARPSATAWNICAGAHFVESSRILEPSGYSHISATSLRPTSCGVKLLLSTKIGPSSVRSSSSTPVGAWAAKNAPCCLENSLLIRRSPATQRLTS